MPLRALVFLLAIATLDVSLPVSAQAPGAPAGAATPDDDRRFRDVTGYSFPPLINTVSAMQNIAYAIQLRDYCADASVPDEFVRAQLARFSQITGRKETCQTLRAY
jgi:hypothetical protein